MKKFLSIIICFIAVISANADNATLNLKNTTVQRGSTTATVDLVLTNDVNIGTITADIVMPKGVSITNVTSVTSVTKNPTYGTTSDGRSIYRIVMSNSDYWIANSESQVAATLTLNVTSDAAMGTNTMYLDYYQLVVPVTYAAYTNNNVAIENTLTIQRAAVIEPMPNGYALEVIPFSPKVGENTLNFMFKAKAAVRTIEFDLTLPKGLLMYNSELAETSPIINTSATTGTPTVNVSSVSDDRTSCHVALTGAAGLSKKYFNASTEYVTCASLTTLVLSDDQFSDDIPQASYGIENGVQTLKISNISMQDNANTTTYYSGDYQTSVFVGTPTETDPIVYGHYTTGENGGQAVLKAAATNFASIDMSTATVDAEESAVAADLSEKLIYGPTKTSYNRSVTGYGTVCLPFELTSGDDVQYYTLSDATSSSLTFSPVTTVNANIPALVKGSIVASFDGYQYASTAGTASTVNGLTLTGTYVKYALASGDGYYIGLKDDGNSYFWGDGATVAPFRAYFAGSVSSSKLSIFINDATGLHEITNQLSDEDIYNLQGIKLNKARKGVNIIGGKKILVK